MTAYEIFRHEKKLSVERQAQRRESAEQERQRAIEEGRAELERQQWNGGRKKAIRV